MAGSIKGITIQIGADTTKLSSALNSANRTIKETQSQLNSVNKALKLDPTNVDLLRDKQSLLTDKVEGTRQKLEALKKAQEQLDAKNVDKNSKEYKELQTQIDVCTQDLKQCEKELKNFGSVGAQQIAAVGEKVKAVGDKITQVGEGLTTHVTAPILAVGAASVAAFTEVDDAMDTIAKKTGASGDALEAMEDSAKSIAETIPTSFDTAAEAIGEVNTRFGLTGDALEGLSTQFVEFAELNDTDVSSSIDNVQKVMSAYNIKTEDASKVLDLLNSVGQNTGISVDTLSEGLVTNAASLQEMGLSASDAATFLGQCEVSGTDTSTVMTGLKKALANAAAEGKTLPDALSEFQATMDSSASDTDKLNAAIDLFGSKSGPAIYEACSSGALSLDTLSTSLDDTAGNVDSTYQTTLDGTDKMTTSMNTFKDVLAGVGESIGNTLAPMLDKVSSFLQTMKEKYDSLSPAQQEMIVKIAMIVAAIGPVLVVVGKVISLVGTIMTLIPMLSTALTVMTGPVGIVVAAIAAAIAIGVLLYKNWDTIKEKATEIWEGIKTAVSNAVTNMKNAVTEKWDAIKSKIANSALGQTAGKVWDAVKTTTSNSLSAIKSAYDSHGGGMKGAVSATMEGIKQYYTAGYNFIDNLTDGKLSSMLGTVKTKMSDVADNVSTKLENVKSYFSEKLTDVATTTQTKLSTVGGYFTSKMSDAATTVSTKLGDMKSNFSSKLGDISSKVSEKMEAARSTFVDKIQQAHDTISGIIEKIKSLFNISLKLDLKFPHISMDGGEPPYGIGGKGHLPSFSVDWYDKGGIFSSPSIIGVGEKRPEFVGALDDLRQIVREESGAAGSKELLQTMSTMVSLMSQLVAQDGMARTITVNQTINASETSYAQQQKQAARQFKEIARLI